jgi:hypothetical protein
VRAALGAGVTYVGRRPLPFGATSGTIFTVDANATLSWTHYELGLTASNLFDNRYRLNEFNYASNFGGTSNSSSQGAPTGPPAYVPSRLFTAGPPRAVFATLAIRFGGT